MVNPLQPLAITRRNLLNPFSFIQAAVQSANRRRSIGTVLHPTLYYLLLIFNPLYIPSDPDPISPYPLLLGTFNLNFEDAQTSLLKQFHTAANRNGQHNSNIQHVQKEPLFLTMKKCAPLLSKVSRDQEQLSVVPRVSAETTRFRPHQPVRERRKSKWIPSPFHASTNDSTLSTLPLPTSFHPLLCRLLACCLTNQLTYHEEWFLRSYPPTFVKPTHTPPTALS